MPPLVQQAIFYIFAFVSGLYIVHLALYLITANVYDVWQSRRLSLRKNRLPEKSELGLSASFTFQRPLVSVVIAARNEASGIVRCLESVRASNYRPIEVLVGDDASTDQTRQLVRDYQLRYPEFNLRVFRMHQNIGKARTLNTLLRRYAGGEFVTALDADSVLRNDTLSKAVSYFHDPTIAGVAANVRIMDEPTVLGVLQKFEHLIGYRSKKMYSLLNCEFVVGGVASTYRMATLRQVGFYDSDSVTEDIGLSIKITALGNHRHRMIYAADVVALTEGVATFRGLLKQRYRWKYGSLQNIVKYHSMIFSRDPRYSRTLTWYRLPVAIMSELMLLVWPVAWGYLIYMSLTQYNLSFLIGAYATITGYILLTVWMDEHLHTVGRLRLSAYALISYFIFMIMDMVQFISVLRCIWRSRALITQKDVGSAWVSPVRTGKNLQRLYEA